MGLIVFIIFGGLAGWIASILYGNSDTQGVGGNIAVGVVGAFLGGFLANLLGGSGITGFNFYSFFVAIVGSLILLSIVRGVNNAARR